MKKNKIELLKSYVNDKGVFLEDVSPEFKNKLRSQIIPILKDAGANFAVMIISHPEGTIFLPFGNPLHQQDAIDTKEMLMELVQAAIDGDTDSRSSDKF